mmetsp:Transcript_31549/g.100470  ORF Transcript_31549/g.100470 Transcript_31549/m.100470 type:complete len:271 (-) Transcript_31549:295-1107(-)
MVCLSPSTTLERHCATRRATAFFASCCRRRLAAALSGPVKILGRRSRARFARPDPAAAPGSRYLPVQRCGCDDAAAPRAAAAACASTLATPVGSSAAGRLETFSGNSKAGPLRWPPPYEPPAARGSAAIPQTGAAAAAPATADAATGAAANAGAAAEGFGAGQAATAAARMATSATGATAPASGGAANAVADAAGAADAADAAEAADARTGIAGAVTAVGAADGLHGRCCAATEGIGTPLRPGSGPPTLPPRLLLPLLPPTMKVPAAQPT